VAGLFLANCDYICRKGKVEIDFEPLKCRFLIMAFHLLLSFSHFVFSRSRFSFKRLLQAFLFFLFFFKSSPLSVLLQVSSSRWCVLSFSPWLVFFFFVVSVVVKGWFFMWFFIEKGVFFIVEMFALYDFCLLFRVLE